MINKYLLCPSLLALGAFVACASASAAPDDAPEFSDCRLYAADGARGISARCGVFERLLDPDDPDSTVLKLKVAVVPSLSLEPEPDPFVPIAGGPGGASTRFYAAYSHAFERVGRDRDILLIDQRGTGDSEIMTCDFGDEVIEGQLSTEETIAYTRMCLEQLPHDPRFFTTSVAVQDLEALRVAMGYPELNLYGSSYGTRVAQHYARRDPDTTRTVVLDGVAPPQVALGPGIAVEAQKALDAIFARCEEDAPCNEAFPGISEQFAMLRAALKEQPVSIELAHPANGEITTALFSDMELAGAIRMMSYSPDTVALIPLLINEASNGNFIPLAATFLTIAESMSDALAIGMHNAVVCTEDSPYYGPLDNDALVGTYIGPVMVEALEAICSVWPAGVIDDGFHVPLDIAKPVLLLSGSADPITPPAFADLAAVDLQNAWSLTGEKQGHGLAGRGCMPRLLGTFIENASGAELDTECMDRLFAMPFFTGFSGPSP